MTHINHYDKLRELAQAAQSREPQGWFDSTDLTEHGIRDEADVAFIAALDPLTVLALLDRIAELEER